MDFRTMSDEELVAAWIDLREQVETPPTDPNPPNAAAPDNSVQLLTDFNAASKERVRRLIPAVDRRGERYEVVRDDGEREALASREDAIARAVAVGEANQPPGDTAG